MCSPPQCAARTPKSSTQRWWICWKRSHRNRSSSPERVRLLQLLIPRPQKRRRPATYSRSQTPELHPDEKVVQDDHFETDPPANMPRGLVHVAGSERCVHSHPGSPPSQTILEIRRGGISIQGPAVWAVPLSPLQQMGIRILNYLDDWLILAQSQAVLTSHKTLLLSHLDCLGHRANFAKTILSRSQWILFLGTVIDSVQMTATVSAERAMTIQHHEASFKEGTARPLKALQKMLGLGSASHATHPVLAEAEGFIRGLASRTPPCNGDSGLCISPGPLEGHLLAKEWRDPRHGA